MLDIVSFPDASPHRALVSGVDAGQRVVERLLAVGRDELSGDLRFETSVAEIGCGVTVPVEVPGGAVVGMLRYVPTDEATAEHDKGFLRVIARLIGERLGDVRAGARPIGAALRVQRVLDRADLAIEFQPIADLRTGRVVGVEALARFPDFATQRPDRWFHEAATCGLGVDLELLAASRALEHLREMPAGAYLSLNCSPSTVITRRFADLLATYPLERLAIEITEHAEVADYERLNSALAYLREHGTRLAIDDAGSGFASLRHILRMSPDIIKLDVSLTRGIDRDPVQRALSFSLTAFASAVDAEVVAEGIESEAEFRALRFLQVACGQGFYLASPTQPPLPTAVKSPVFSPTSAA